MAQIIDRAQFEQEQREYRNIQRTAVPILDAHRPPIPPNARRFYLDSQEESFVFEKNLILDLLNQPFAQYLRVYYGAIPPGPNPVGRAPGSPTIILGAARRINPFTDVGDLYVEWPEGLDPNGNPIP
jgi:hypothetical protein